MKILAIDDSKTMRLAIKITFATEGAEVVAVSRGSEAVVRAQQMPADVVLVDHTLADGEPSGYDVVRSLKGTPATAKIPVLMLVPARAPDEAAVKACGADGWIGKPFDTQELIDKVTAAKAKGATGVVSAAPAPAPAAAAARPAAAAAAAPAAAPAAPAARPAAPAPAAAPAAPVAARAPAVPAPASAATVIQSPRPASPPKPAAPAPIAAPAAAKPAAGLGPVPGVAPRPAAAPVAAAPAPAAVARPPSGPSAGPRPSIPIAIPIPFTAADSPSKGMLDRLAKAQGVAPGVDPKLIEGLLSLSREVVESIVWEVVPDLAEQIVRERAAG